MRLSPEDEVNRGSRAGEKAGQGSGHVQVARRQLFARSDHVPLVVQSDGGATSRQPFTPVWCINASVVLQHWPHSHWGGGQ